MDSSTKECGNEKETRGYLSEPCEPRDTFVVKMQMRQNATWQGTLTWLDKKKTRNFRSMFEMLKLMDEAVSDSRQEKNNDELKWD